MSVSASGPLSAAHLPVWVGWIIGVGGCALLAGALYWITPPYRRRQTMTQRVLPALAMGLLFAGVLARPAAGQLVLGGGVFAVAALPLFWMGKLPPDMPSARDRRIGRHPDYLRVARRGRIAGVALVVLEVAWAVIWASLS